jgi:hypothetical protein
LAFHVIVIHFQRFTCLMYLFYNVHAFPLVTRPKAVKPWPSGLRKPPRSNEGGAPLQMKNSEVAVLGSTRAIDNTPFRCLMPVC